MPTKKHRMKNNCYNYKKNLKTIDNKSNKHESMDKLEKSFNYIKE